MAQRPLVPNPRAAAPLLMRQNDISEYFQSFVDPVVENDIYERYPDWDVKVVRGVEGDGEQYTNLDAAKIIIQTMNDDTLSEQEKLTRIQQLNEVADFPPSFKADLMLCMAENFKTPESRSFINSLYFQSDGEYTNAYKNFMREPKAIIDEKVSENPELCELINRGMKGEALTADERKKLVSELVNLTSEAYGIEPPKLEFTLNDNSLAGQYLPVEHVLQISERFFMWDSVPELVNQLMQTTEHEMNHAGQMGLVTRAVQGEIPPDSPEYMLAKIYAANALQYGEPTLYGELYKEVNPLEEHANRAEESIVRRIIDIAEQKDQKRNNHALSNQYSSLPGMDDAMTGFKQQFDKGHIQSSDTEIDTLALAKNRDEPGKGGTIII